ncbi:hypothetical protein JX265_008244 [Neoarthrinium moseri]|uniref:Uncharacterized protein n=1 Tax=Neoarthrinium moseri TaxID=1658444 RepID=A0A9P9WIG4_9PEZI|nr:uncharacterized protein JN550_004943 [Neoarthrinium moseri]KAI1865197.1 hypothetical protein JX265_008244 [Neoarthrinium moseri]KAI1870797.1 hypothetical protein JN550_004943 [Neoarthrinium moseri]
MLAMPRGDAGEVGEVEVGFAAGCGAAPLAGSGPEDAVLTDVAEAPGGVRALLLHVGPLQTGTLNRRSPGALARLFAREREGGLWAVEHGERLVGPRLAGLG